MAAYRLQADCQEPGSAQEPYARQSSMGCLFVQVFVGHALSYLTASRNGLSDAELEDVLSLDDTVLNDVFQHWLPPLRRLPPLLIPRLVDELGRYLVEREANGTSVVYWYQNGLHSDNDNDKKWSK